MSASSSPFTCNSKYRITIRDADHYGKIIAKIVEKGSDYVTAESGRLKRMLASGSVADAKADLFTKKINILNLFEAAFNRKNGSAEADASAPVAGGLVVVPEEESSSSSDDDSEKQAPKEVKAAAADDSSSSSSSDDEAEKLAAGTKGTADDDSSSSSSSSDSDSSDAAE